MSQTDLTLLWNCAYDGESGTYGCSTVSNEVIPAQTITYAMTASSAPSVKVYFSVLLDTFKNFVTSGYVSSAYAASFK
jgi:hypothetical protein